MAATVTGISRNIPFIMEVRDLWPAIFVELGVLKNPFIIRMLEMLEMALYHKATRVISVTESFRRNLIKRGVSASKVVTIPNGADTDYWQPAERSSHLKCQLGLDNHFIVLYIGAHGISHALGRILDVAERLRNNQNIHFLFVGEGAEKDQLIRRAQQARLENVDFLKPVDRKGVREFYAMADVCLVPLRDIPLFETFIPSKMFEIMAMGRPIIGSLRGEGADIIRQSGAGIVVEPEDLEGIVQAILYLFRNRKKGQSMGENGRHFVCKNYSRDSLAKKYAQVINEAIRDFRGNNP
jgi:glycosyltransferase involved in cell wall biosynthesis